jgi:pyridoxine 4-dehydrogenase
MYSTTLTLAGVDVPRIGLGTNRMAATAQGIAFIQEAVAAGLKHVDTAHLYMGGQSEAAIGAALSPIPNDCVVATKGGFRPGDGHPDVLRRQLEESLRRLRTDSLALFYLHRIDPQTPLEVSLGAIAECKESGKVRHVGVSEVGIGEIEHARQVVPIAAVQNRFNLSDRDHDDVVDYCAAEGIVFVPFYPLHGGENPALVDIAARHNATPQQIALAWLLRRSPVMLPIPGTLSLDHLKENLAALEIELSDAEYEALL